MPAPAASKARGARAETAALSWLQGRGLTLIERNFQCRLGEIDLILHDGDMLVVTEVRYRKHSDDDARYSIDIRKRQRIRAATLAWLQRHREYDDSPVRFDVVIMSGALDAPDIEWLSNAFQDD